MFGVWVQNPESLPRCVGIYETRREAEDAIKAWREDPAQEWFIIEGREEQGPCP